jgi:hypothetical protein
MVKRKRNFNKPATNIKNKNKIKINISQYFFLAEEKGGFPHFGIISSISFVVREYFFVCLFFLSELVTTYSSQGCLEAEP